MDKQVSRARRLVLVRHGESEGNLQRTITQDVPDHALHLTAKGREQALEAGRKLKTIIGDESVEFVTSPYVRAKETLFGIAQAWGGKEQISFKEDVYIREQDFGNFDKPEARQLHKEKKMFGKFYYRFPEGESPADLYQRAGLFLESLYRRWETKYIDNLVIVSHELFIIVFMMRLFRWPVQDFYAFEDLTNCEVIVLERPADTPKYSPTYTWPSGGGDKKPGGLTRKKDAPQEMEMWDGNPESKMLHNEPRKTA